MISNRAVEYIRKLVGQPLRKICCEIDMAEFCFGNIVKLKGYNGKERVVSEYALHVQCPFRIVSVNESIVLSSYDMCIDENSQNRFDVYAQKWNQSNCGITVKDVSINQQGDLNILFNNGDRLQIFVDVSADEECWRFFKLHDYFDNNPVEEHLVIYGIGDRFE